MRSGPILWTAHGVSFSALAPHTRVSYAGSKKKLSFRKKRGFAPGIMDSCPRASVVLILKGVLG